MKKTAAVVAAALATALFAQEPSQPDDAFARFAEEWFGTTNAPAAWVDSHPVLVGAIRRNGTADLSACACAETANIVAEYAANPEPAVFGRDLAALKKDVLRSALKIMKRALRARGMSFVVGPDGSNPIQAAVDPLSDALNSGRMAGVREWLAEWVPGTEWVEPAWMPDDGVAELADSVYFGDVDFDAGVQFRLCAVMGVSGYNRFVDRYNGTEEPEPNESGDPAAPGEPAAPAVPEEPSAEDGATPEGGAE